MVIKFFRKGGGEVNVHSLKFDVCTDIVLTPLEQSHFPGECSAHAIKYTGSLSYSDVICFHQVPIAAG